MFALWPFIYKNDSTRIFCCSLSLSHTQNIRFLFLGRFIHSFIIIIVPGTIELKYLLCLCLCLSLNLFFLNDKKINQYIMSTIVTFSLVFQFQMQPKTTTTTTTTIYVKIFSFFCEEKLIFIMMMMTMMKTSLIHIHATVCLCVGV